MPAAAMEPKQRMSARILRERFDKWPLDRRVLIARLADPSGVTGLANDMRQMT